MVDMHLDMKQKIVDWIESTLDFDIAYHIKDGSPISEAEYDFSIYFQYTCFLSEECERGHDAELVDKFSRLLLADDYTFELITPQTVGVYQYEED